MSGRVDIAGQKRERLRDQAVEAHHPVAQVKMESTNLKYREIEKF